MVHVLAPRPPLSALPVFFNVDTSVGRNGQNNSVDDIMLVQFLISLIAKNPSPGSQLTRFANLPVTGHMNDETIAAIDAVQVAGALQKDGRVSVAKGYSFGTKFYTIVSLNFSVRKRFPANWPNIEELPGCPGLLNLACRRALVGTD